MVTSKFRQEIAESQTVEKLQTIQATKIDQLTIENKNFDSLNSVQFFDEIGMFAKFAQAQVFCHSEFLLLSILDT